jgi:hypothetical protein
MKGWITLASGERPFKAWAWDGSIFADCKISFHATFKDALSYLRGIGAKTIDVSREAAK